MDLVNHLIKEILSGKITTHEQLMKLKRQMAKHYNVQMPRNADIYNAADEITKVKIRHLLQMKPVRTMSGVAVVAVMTPPHKCPHGRCLYCPKGKDAPQSYTGMEPAARRAMQNAYSPYNQTFTRLTQLTRTGHNPQKVELIIMGGTFPSCANEEQEIFVKGCFAAMNDFPKPRQWQHRKLEHEMLINEGANVRCVGMTMETRPDYCKHEHVMHMLSMGCTRVELGVQTIYNRIYKKINRGHTVKDVIEATKILKDFGFKVLYHMMPGLPGSTFESDVKMFKEIFSNPDFMPDMLKIYPTLVIGRTDLYKLWKEGKYKPVDEAYMLRLLKEVKSICPEWVRIMRIERDIPGTEIKAGIKSTNLRQIAAQQGIRCNCIRCREVGHAIARGKTPDLNSAKLDITKYSASGGTEYFLQFKDKHNILFGFLRLRLNKTSLAYVRELHVYGEQVPLGMRGAIQHIGFGKRLLKAAEEIAKKQKKEKLRVISGVGVREYYLKQGYSKEGNYVAKSLI